MIAVDRAFPGHAVCPAQKHLTRNIANGRCDRRDRHLSKVPRSRSHGSESAQADFCPGAQTCTTGPRPSHSSPHFCSLSHKVNSVLETGFRRYPRRCFCSSFRFSTAPLADPAPGEQPSLHFSFFTLHFSLRAPRSTRRRRSGNPARPRADSPRYALRTPPSYASAAQTCKPWQRPMSILAR